MLLDLCPSPNAVTLRGRPRPSCSHRIHACQRSAKTAIVRYSEPAMMERPRLSCPAHHLPVWTHAAWCDAREGRAHNTITYRFPNSRQYYGTTGRALSNSLAPGHKSPNPPPRTNAFSSREPCSGSTPAPPRLRVSKPCGARMGQYHNEFVLTILPNISTNVEMSRKLPR